MKARTVILVVAACVTGAICGEFLCRSISFRSAIGKMVGRGELVALVHDSGIYEQDLTRGLEKSALIANAVVDFRAREEVIKEADLDREYNLLKSQIGDAKNWSAALLANRLCPWTLRRSIAQNLRDERWLDRQLASGTSVSAEECREYFDANRTTFTQPVRFRAAHLFLAAPPETDEEIVDVKRRTIEELAKRLEEGEEFADLVAQFSEDEATKKRGGDLNYFSELRMPPDFMSAIERLQVGKRSGVIQTKLGFHIIELTDRKEGRAMMFDEARSEIAAQLENRKRRDFVRRLTVDLASKADFSR